ncbi:SMI1/KNR4 family protein [Salinactinospora qingdaonensis]|uniref:Knr4/Smi1-like domain-containing protein n=1 Tax=Salinactinospora qingdaonensis TaxID=702744 RepID=A0ABP7F5W4_9ACTN
MNSKYSEIDQMIAELVDAGLADADAVSGCTEEQISELQAMQSNVQLPDDYLYFLRVAGANPLKYLSVEIDIRSAICAFDIAEEMLEEAPDFDLSGKIFIGNYHFDYVYFFKMNDPGVYVFDEVEERRVCGSFVEFLRWEVNASRKDWEAAKRFSQKIREGRT